SNRDIAVSALKGYVEALFYIPRNREETRRITAKYMRTTDPEVLDATYERFVKRGSKKPYPTLKGIQYLLDEVAAKLPNAKSAKPEQFVDLSLLQQFEREGFFAEMAKRYPEGRWVHFAGGIRVQILWKGLDHESKNRTTIPGH